MSYSPRYFITEVCYDENNEHIEKVKIYENVGGTLRNEDIWVRSKVVRNLHQNIYIMTYYHRNGRLQPGAPVGIYTRDGEEYIKTKSDGVRRDNLDELPMFECDNDKLVFFD